MKGYAEEATNRSLLVLEDYGQNKYKTVPCPVEGCTGNFELTFPKKDPGIVDPRMRGRIETCAALKFLEERGYVHKDGVRRNCVYCNDKINYNVIKKFRNCTLTCGFAVCPDHTDEAYKAIGEEGSFYMCV